jgi:hypothetical protein
VGTFITPRPLSCTVVGIVKSIMHLRENIECCPIVDFQPWTMTVLKMVNKALPFASIVCSHHWDRNGCSPDGICPDRIGMVGRSGFGGYRQLRCLILALPMSSSLAQGYSTRSRGGSCTTLWVCPHQTRTQNHLDQ